MASSRLGIVSMMSISRMIAISSDAAEEARDQAEHDAHHDRDGDHRDADRRATAARRRSGARGCRGRWHRCRADRRASRPACQSRRLQEHRAVGQVGRMRRDPAARSSATSSTTMTITRSPTTAPRLAQKACQNSRQGGRAAPRRRGRVLRGLVGRCHQRFSVPDARVDDAVGHVDQQVDQHHDGAEQQHAALQHRIVAPADGLDQPFADAGPGEDGLGEDGAGEQHADLQADHRDDRDQRIAQRMQRPPRESGDRPLARAVRM